MPKWKHNELVVELVGSKNEYFLFRPLRTRLRGRWSRNNIVGMAVSGRAPEYANMPDIPGIHVCLDVKGRILQAIDPLGFPENKKILDEANRIRKPWQGEGQPWNDMVSKSLTDSEIKSAMWYIAALHRTGKTRLVHGGVPDRKDILKMPGRLKIRYHHVNVTDGETEYATEEELAVLAGEELAESAAME